MANPQFGTTRGGITSRMGRWIIASLLLLGGFSAVSATTIRVSNLEQPSQFTVNGSVTMRIMANSTFTDSAGQLIIGVPNFYFPVACTVADRVLRCAPFDLPATTDGSASESAAYRGVIYDSQGRQIETVFDRWKLPHNRGTAITYEDWRGFNFSGEGSIVNRSSSLFTSLITPQEKTVASIFGSNSPTDAMPNSLRATLQPPVATPQEGTSKKIQDKNRGQVYDNGTSTTRGNLGVFNVQDFKAMDNDSADSTAPIQAAIDAASAEGGGIVRLSYSSNGVYRINGPIVYKQGVIIEGETSAVGAKVKLKLTASNSAAILVGENLSSVVIRNLELLTSGTTNSKGILFTGSGSNATQIVNLEGITINGFARGISVEAKDPTKAWQISYMTGKNLVLHGCLYGIYLDSINTDWHLSDVVTYTLPNGYGLYCNTCGTIQIDHSNFLGAGQGEACPGGRPNSTYGEAAIRVEGHHGPITVTNTQQEGFRKSLIQNREEWTYPIVFMNTVMGAPIELNADTLFVSIGNYYYDDTVRAKGDTRIFSMGDSIDPRNGCLQQGKNVGGFTLSDGALIVKRDSIYGTDYQMPVAINTAAPSAVTGNPGNPANPLLSIGSPAVSHVLMRLGQTDSGSRALNFYYDVSRDSDGYLLFFGSQADPYKGLKTNGVMKAVHFAGSGNPPVAAAGSANAVGSGAQVSVAGTDAAFEVTLRTGSGVRGGGPLLTITFSVPYSSTPYEVFSASSSDSAELAAKGVGVYSSSTNTNLVLTSVAPLADSRTYKFKFQVKQ